jgi:ABC-2 type transport system permease protein
MMMMTTTTSQPLLAAATIQPRPLLAALALCQRELVRFLRQRNRVFGALGQPIIFWVLFSAGLSSSNLGYAHFSPGTLVMILLFTAIFATISLIEDRREGFLQGVLVAPLPRWSMVLGKILGGTALAMLQGGLFLLLGWITLRFHPGFAGWIGLFVLMAILSFALTSLGFLIAWRIDSTQGFHAIMSVLLLPMWLLSGAFFPPSSGWLGWIVAVNPLTYGVAGLRRLLELPGSASMDQLPNNFWCWGVTIVFGLVAFAAAWRIAGQRTTGDLL